MIEHRYKNAFKEVFDILKNTEEELRSKIPTKFVQFIESNMNREYETNIQTDIGIDKQVLLKETEAVLSLIYRSYWATDIEKIEYMKKDKQELKENEENKRQQIKDIDEIFKKRKNFNRVTLDTNLMVVPKEKFIQKILKKLKNLFKK